MRPTSLTDGVEQAHPAVGPGDRPDVPSRSWRLRTLLVVTFCVCVFFVGFGGVTAWQSLVSLPRTYHHLRTAGQPATARIVKCAHRGCTLEVSFGGRTREWMYAQDKHQFAGLGPGAPVNVLVDPHHPSTVYTTVDVTRNTNAGWSGSAIYGVVLFVVGLLGLFGLARLVRFLRRLYGTS
ncbi:MAG TPA: DUF3592 domain-containing protein [Gaiellaceae bacterium]